jgi:glutamine synthetase
VATGRNLFRGNDGELPQSFLWYIGGMQTYLPRVMCMLAPYVNS